MSVQGSLGGRNLSVGSTLGPSGLVWPLGTHLTPPHPPTSKPTQVKTRTSSFLVACLVFRVKLGNLFSETLNCANISDDKVGLGKKKIPSQGFRSLH